MTSILKRVSAPLMTCFLVMIGSGLFSTLTSVRLRLDGQETYVIGLIAAAYNIGILIGSFHFVPFLRRVGHIRAYAACGAFLTVAVLLQGLFTNDYLWALTRAVGGYTLAAIYMVVESWLINSTTPKIRGQVMAFYMIAAYAGLGIGQFFLTIGDVLSITPFIIIAIATSLSIVPLAQTRQASPQLEPISRMNVFDMAKKIPIGITGCIVSGIIVASVLSIFPVYFDSVGYTTQNISYLMAATIFGAMLFQIPVGKISDMVDRRKVLIFISILGILMSLFILKIYDQQSIFLVTLFIFGGMTFTIFPVVLSHSCDLVDPDHAIDAIQTLLIAYAVGCVIGPLAAPFFMSLLGNGGLFIMIIGACLILALTCIIRIQIKAPIPDEDKVNYVAVQMPTPVTPELDPRIEE